MMVQRELMWIITFAFMCFIVDGNFLRKRGKPNSSNMMNNDGPLEVLLNEATTITDLELNLYQVAVKTTNTDTEAIINHYRLPPSISEYINRTSFKNIATCLDLGGQTHSIDSIFNRLKHAANNPKEAITQFLSRLKTHPDAQRFYDLMIHNYASSFLTYCSSYPAILASSGYSEFLGKDLAKEFDMTTTELSKDTAQMQMTLLLPRYALSQWTGIGKEEAAQQLKDNLLNYYDAMSVASIDLKLQKGRAAIMNMSVMYITTEYAQVSTKFLQGILKLATFSDQTTRVLSELTLNELDNALGTDLAREKLKRVITVIEEKGSYTSMVFRQPLVVALERVGFIGLNKMMNQRVMDLFVKVTERTEPFLISWFNISPEQVVSLTQQKLSKYFLVNFPSLQPTQLQIFPSIKLADKRWMASATTSTERLDIVKKEFFEIMTYILGRSSMDYLKTIYEIPDGLLYHFPLVYAFSRSSGLEVADMNKFLPQATVNLMTSLQLIRLIDLSPETLATSSTLTAFSTNLTTATKDMRLQEFLSSPVGTLKTFRNHDETTFNTTFNDLIAAHIGVPFDQLNMGNTKSAVQQLAKDSLEAMKSSFLRQVRQTFRKDVTTINEISETLTIRQLAVMIVHNESFFLLRDYNSLAQKMIELDLNDTVRFGDVLECFTSLSPQLLELILTNYLADHDVATSILDISMQDIKSKLQPGLSQMTLSDIFVILQPTLELNVFLPLKLLKYKCINTTFVFSENTAFEAIRKHCIGSSKFLKIVNFYVLEKLTPSDLNTLKGDMVYDVMSLDYMTAVSLMEKVNNILNYAANTPILVNAQEHGISVKELEPMTNLEFSLTVCRKFYPVTEDIFAKIFNLSPAVLVSAKYATYKILSLNFQINVKKLYTLPLLNIFEIQAATKTIQDVEDTEFPRFLRMLCMYDFNTIAKTNNDSVMTYYDRDIMSILKQTFGANAEDVRKTFGIDIADTEALEKSKIKDILQLGGSLHLLTGDIFYNSPISLMSVLFGISPYKLQAFLLSRPEDIAKSLNVEFDTLGLVREYIGFNSHGVTVSEIKSFINQHIHFAYPLVNAAEVFDSFMNTNITLLSEKYGKNMRSEVWMTIFSYVLVDHDECTVNNGGCHGNATCINSPGSCTCLCKRGYTGDGLTCKPVEDCGGKFCHMHAKCLNDTCRCDNGFVGDGVKCDG